ncbi:hypothetical protein DF16_pBMB8240orf00012 (plasmid) [Bacillus thuringiensis serovar kurstaki str. YBT-1520]|nr:hypothetical protein DF16_pBMB8240orf00012 [Bacillus thuringiensis serovar kurstaki str. YBT-1520]
MTTKRPRKLGRLFINWWSLGGHFFILMVICWHLVVTQWSLKMHQKIKFVVK